MHPKWCHRVQLQLRVAVGESPPIAKEAETAVNAVDKLLVEA